MSDLIYEPEIEQGWEAAGEEIPSGLRRALSLNVFGSKLFDRLMKIFTSRIKSNRDALVDRALWTDIPLTGLIFRAETTTEYPPQLGVINGQAGIIWRKLPSKAEPVYCRARAKYADGAVRLRLTADGSTAGNAVIAVGVSTSLTGTWSYYYGTAPWTFNPAQTLQTYDIVLSDLTVGTIYYYRILRESGAAGDTLSASVLLEGVQLR